jgi:hypothetical protein
MHPSNFEVINEISSSNVCPQLAWAPAALQTPKKPAKPGELQTKMAIVKL